MTATRFEVLDLLDRCNVLALGETIRDARATGVLTVADHRALDELVCALQAFHAHCRRSVE